jgi:hypothetical protein
MKMNFTSSGSGSRGSADPRDFTESIDDEISPFDPNAPSSTFVLYLEPILNTYYQTYQTVISISQMPAGPLRRMVSSINPPKTSEFQTASPFYSNPTYGLGVGAGSAGCVMVLLRYPLGRGGISGYSAFVKDAGMVLGADDIPSLFSYLRERGYRIDTELTRMLQDSDVSIGGPATTRMSGNRRMIAMVHYTGSL